MAMNVYSSLKIFHFPEKLASLPRETPVTPPLHIRWKPTNRCNHRCRYCAYRQDGLQLGQDMREQDAIPPDKMREIVRDLVEMGVKAVTFSGGGEPLCYPHLLEASRILHDGGVKLACLTNGALLDGEIAAFFAHNAVWVRVSMDGWDDASYSRYRGVKDGEYTRIMRNMEAFAALGSSCVLGVSLIVDADNADRVEESLRRLKEAGVHSVKVSACIVSDMPAANNAYHAPHFERVREAIEKAKADLADNSFEIVDAWHALAERFSKDYEWCPFVQISPVIAADLGVYPCHDKAYNRAALLGSLTAQSFKAFWMRGKECFFRIRPCRDCAHHCMVNNKNQMILEYLNCAPGHLDFV
jgi:MoaA/NifB/PqqE/SkfB family radical SAM enzyme